MNWHSGLPSLHCSTSDVLMSERIPEFGFPLSSNPPSPSLSPTLSSAHIESFDTWQEATYSRHLLTPLELQAMDSEDTHYSSCDGCGSGSGYESDMFTTSQEMSINTQGMLQIPVRSQEVSSLNARCSPYPDSPSPQPQSLHPLNTSLAETSIEGSPSPQHIDAAQFRVLMNEATNRIKALAEVDNVSPSQPSPLATNVGFLNPNNPPTLAAYAHNVPRVYLRRSHSVESLVAEPVPAWTTAEQIGQVNSAQFLFQQHQHQQHLQYIEQQHLRNQQQQMVDYPMASSVTVMPTGDINHMNQLSMNMVQMHMGLMNGNNYDPMAIVDNHMSRVSSPMPMVKAIRNRRPLSACSYSSIASPSFSVPSTASPSPILHSTNPVSLISSIHTPSRKRQNLCPNIKTGVTLTAPSHSTLSASASASSSSSPSATPFLRLQSSSLNKTRPKRLANKTRTVQNNKNGNNGNNSTNKPKSIHKPPVNRFICPLPGCGRTFSRPFNLKSHGMTHETLRPYGCDQCDKTFARIHDRDRHLKGHLVEKAHFCVVCQGKFARQDAVTRHLKLNKENNPCAVILKASGASFRDAAAGRVSRRQLGDEVAVRRRFQELEDDAKKVKATKTLEKGMLSMHLLTMSNRPPLNIPHQKHQRLQLQTPMSSASQSPLTPQSYSTGGRGFGSPSSDQ
ncbi:hypothetical protein BGZ96_011654 [Linnemannia gamsii]|uniref:C2H2-type domain-containing protein n=1 Tax=Linnemannia gamsii TaxID=64522 RepID=A0ABQ7KD07_9FUNG|nr:hypothetical protein BGZ96_011654 [Linnemannia gamsii]